MSVRLSISGFEDVTWSVESVGRFRTACKVLGRERVETLTIHHGRHTFISHSLAGDRKLAEVRDAAGHANVSITSAYLHVAVEDDGVGELFRF
jgi:integrase